MKRFIAVVFAYVGLLSIATASTLENNVQDPYGLAESVGAFMMITGDTSTAVSSLILVDVESLENGNLSIATKCDLRSKGSLRLLSGKTKSLKTYRSIKKLVRRHQTKYVFLVAKVERNNPTIEFGCVFSSYSASLYSGVLPQAEDALLKAFNTAILKAEMPIKGKIFKTEFTNDRFKESPVVAPKSFYKDEFETQVQFDYRKNEYLQSIKPYIYTSEGNLTTYDPDSRSLLIGALGVKTSLDLIESNITQSFYETQNAYGTKLTVTKYEGDRLYIEYAIPRFFARESIPFPLGIAKQNLKDIAYTVRVSVPFQNPRFKRIGQAPEFSSPVQKNIYENTYLGSVRSLEIGNKVTGDMYFSYEAENQDQDLLLDRNILGGFSSRGSLDAYYEHQTQMKFHNVECGVSDFRSARLSSYDTGISYFRYNPKDLDKSERCHRFFSSQQFGLMPLGMTKLLPQDEVVISEGEELKFRFDHLITFKSE
jgi:hypothetical protein